MPSKKSYFNKAVFLNTTKRFWPLWGAYLALMLIMLPATQAVNWLGDSWSVVRDIYDLAQTLGAVLGMGYSILAAMAVWSFAYNSKTASGISCLPVRREGVFLSVSLAGLLPALVGNVVAFGLTMLVHAGRGYASVIGADALAFVVMTLMLIFFYGFAALCAQLTGNIVILPAVYLLLNFTAAIVEAILCAILDFVVYGVNCGSAGISAWLSPVVGMLNGGAHVEREYIAAYGENRVLSVSYEGLGFLIVCALVGLIMLWGALALYRRRNMESAGDVVAVRVLKPVFRYCMAFGFALVAGIGFHALFIQNLAFSPLGETLGTLFFMLVGSLIGWFAAEMLIRKSFRVFRGCWRGLFVSMAVICLFMLGAEFDLLGVENRVPQAEDVDYVRVNASDTVEYREAENIQKIIALHNAALDNKSIHEWGEGMGSYFGISYHLKNGKILERQYYLRCRTVSQEGLEDVEALESLQNSPEAISWRKQLPFTATEEKVLAGSYKGLVTTDEMLGLESELSPEELIIINYYGYDSYYVLHQMSEAEKLRLINDFQDKQGELSRATTYTWTLTPEETWELYTECIIPDMNEGSMGRLWIVEDEDYFSTVCSGEISIEFWYYEDELKHRQEMTADAIPYTVETPNEYYVGSGRDTHHFRITPTVGSRTYNWLLDHGIILHTVGDELEMYGGYTMFGK